VAAPITGGTKLAEAGVIITDGAPDKVGKSGVDGVGVGNGD